MSGTTQGEKNPRTPAANAIKRFRCATRVPPRSPAGTPRATGSSVHERLDGGFERLLARRSVLRPQQGAVLRDDGPERLDRESVGLRDAAVVIVAVRERQMVVLHERLDGGLAVEEPEADDG